MLPPSSGGALTDEVLHESPRHSNFFLGGGFICNIINCRHCVDMQKDPVPYIIIISLSHMTRFLNIYSFSGLYNGTAEPLSLGNGEQFVGLELAE